MDQAQRLRTMMGRTTPLRVVAVTSGKGGVGKTHVAVNLSVLAARAGRRVLLVDADLGLANADIVLGAMTTFHLGHLLNGTAGVDDVLARGPHGVRIMGAGSGLQELTRLDDLQKRRLVAALEPLEDRFDLVVIDCGAGIGDNVVFFARAAQQALLVVSPEPTSLTDAYAAVKVLSQRGGQESFQVVVNPVPGEMEAHGVYQRLTQVTDRFLTARVSYLGHVPRDENLQRALMAQRPVVELYPRSPCSRAFQAIADRLLAEQPPPLKGGFKFLWQRLLRESTGPARGSQP